MQPRVFKAKAFLLLQLIFAQHFQFKLPYVGGLCTRLKIKRLVKELADWMDGSMDGWMDLGLETTSPFFGHRT